MSVSWLLQEAGQVEPGESWLGEAERKKLAAFRFERRRADWRLGRWTAKRALASSLGEPPGLEALARLEIRNDPEGAPAAFRNGEPLPRTISISHRDGAGLCAVAPAGVALGCDLERVEPRSEAFVADYFGAEERAQVARCTPVERIERIALIWSAKESALKALGVGLRRDTRGLRVEVAVPVAERGWRPLRVQLAECSCLDGWWRREGRRVISVVAHPSTGRPARESFESDDRAHGREMRISPGSAPRAGDAH